MLKTLKYSSLSTAFFSSLFTFLLLWRTNQLSYENWHFPTLAFFSNFFVYTADRMHGLKANDRNSDPDKIRWYNKNKKTLVTALGTALIICLGIVSQVSPSQQIACLGACILGGLYLSKVKIFGLRVKAIAGLKEFIVASTWLVSSCLILIQSEMNTQDIKALGLCFALALSNVIICDLHDAKLDREANILTLSARYPQATRYINGLSCAALSAYSLFCGQYGFGLVFALYIILGIRSHKNSQSKFWSEVLLPLSLSC